MPSPPRLASAFLSGLGTIRHGFYGRRGGVSSGVFSSLNCSPFSADSRDAIRANRQRVADDLAAPRRGEIQLFSNQQIHGARVRVIEAGADADEIHRSDGLVTAEPGVCLGVLAADCAPVLFADASAAVIGAAHAGWRGALLGVTDAVIETMTRLGARPGNITCVIGPAIQRGSYRVGAEFFQRFQADSPLPCADCFRETGGEDETGGGYYFDLPRYLRMRLARAGIASIEALPEDTFADEEQFFSYRRSCQRGEADCGRQVGAIALA